MVGKRIQYTGQQPPSGAARVVSSGKIVPSLPSQIGATKVDPTAKKQKAATPQGPRGSIASIPTDISRVLHDVRFRVVDAFEGVSRPWGPYFAVKPSFYELDAPELISAVERRAAERAFVAPTSPDSPVQISVPALDGPPVAQASGSDDRIFLDQIQARDANIRLRYGLPARAAGEPFYSGVRHPSDASPQMLKVTEPLFSGQAFWMLGTNGLLNRSTERNGAGVLPSGEFIIAKRCSDSAPSPATSFRWSTESIQVLLRTRRGVVPGPVVPHICDLSAAQWWWRLGFALASDNSIVEALDRVNTKTGRFDLDPNASAPEGWYAQVAYVEALFQCVANGFNSANIPWYIDPLSRQLFRDWFAGHASNEFDSRTDYNDGLWFSAREQCGERRFAVLRPRIGENADQSAMAGEMPSRLRSMWKNLVSAQDSRVLEFVQRAGVMLWSTGADSDPYMASEAYNRSFATNLTMYGPTNELAGHWWDARAFARGSGSDPKGSLSASERGYLDSGESPWNLWAHRPVSEGFASDWYAKILHAPPLQPRDRISDWRAGGFDHPGTASVHVQGTVPLRWYVAYAREWLRMLCQDEPVSSELPPDMPSVRADRRWSGFAGATLPRRSVGEVLQQSLSYALDVNLTWGSLYGGRERLAAALVEKSAQFGRSQPNRAIRAVTGVVSGIGGAVGSALLPGVGALVGTGVDFLGSILAVAIPSYDCSGYGRDDLGRPKPMFERTYLGGNPETGTDPSFSVPLPFAFCRTRVELPPILPVPVSEPDSPAAPQVETKSNVLGTLVPVGLALASAAVVYYSLRRSSSE